MKKIILLLLLFLSVENLFAQSDSVSVNKSDTVSVNKSDSVKLADSVAVAYENKPDVITQPEFRGGITKMYEYISENFVYPEEAQRRSVRGKIEVEFTVEKSGDISSVNIIKGLDFSVDNEILRILKAMPLWTPATKNGVPVRYRVSMPINLRVSRNMERSSASINNVMEN